MERIPSEIDERAVAELVARQFPEFAHLAVHRVVPGGWDHLTFRLGPDMAARIPSHERYAPQIGRENAAFVGLADQLPVAIPRRVRTGQPDPSFAQPWAINRWVTGNPATSVAATEMGSFAHQCGGFLRELHSITADGTLMPEPANFHRGGDLQAYADEVGAALALLTQDAMRDRARDIWQAALAAPWTQTPRWVHGDFFPWNLLVDDAMQLCGVIDWGLVAHGDPACDLALAWTCFDGAQRSRFRDALMPDEATWRRGRGWALWKALTLATGINSGPADDVAQSRVVLTRICNDRVD